MALRIVATVLVIASHQEPPALIRPAGFRSGARRRIFKPASSSIASSR
jgi:hypothetical protein